MLYIQGMITLKLMISNSTTKTPIHKTKFHSFEAC